MTSRTINGLGVGLLLSGLVVAFIGSCLDAPLRSPLLHVGAGLFVAGIVCGARANALLEAAAAAADADQEVCGATLEGEPWLSCSRADAHPGPHLSHEVAIWTRVWTWNDGDTRAFETDVGTHVADVLAFEVAGIVR